MFQCRKPRICYAVSTVIFLALFVAAVTAQIRSQSFHPLLYWTVIVATTTVGTTLADFADRSLGIGDVGGSLVLFGLVRFVLLILTRSLGATLGDFLTKPLSTGGLNLGRFSSSAVRLGMMIALVALTARGRERPMSARICTAADACSRASMASDATGTAARARSTPSPSVPDRTSRSAGTCSGTPSPRTS